MKKLFFKYFKNEDGATAVEFGMVSVLFLVFIFSIIEFSRIYWTMNALEYAIENTARYAMVNKNASDITLVDYARTSMSGMQPDVASLDVTTVKITIGGVSFIEVDGTYKFTTIFPFLPSSMNSIELQSSARAPYAL